MFAGRTALVTGGGSGIGRALAQALAAEGARVAVVDRDLDAARLVAAPLGGLAIEADLRRSQAIRHAVSQAETLGRIDILVSNAGVARGAIAGPASADDDQWQEAWDLHVMAHLRAARLVLPGMLARGEGWLVNLASAAGLLSQIGDAPYSASKHAAVSLAQSLAIEHGDAGITVSCVCPLYVATPMLGYPPDGPPAEGVLRPQDVAQATLDGMRAGRFLILPHPEAAVHFHRRARDTDRWIVGMQRLRDKIHAGGAPQDIKDLIRRL